MAQVDRTNRVEAFVRRLPKTETHLHFEGAVPWNLSRMWSDKDLPETPAYWDPAHRFDDFSDFLAAMADCWKPHLDSLDRIAEAASGVYSSLAGQNVRYLEMSFGLAAHRVFRVSDIVEALKRDVPEGIEVRIIGAVSRDRDLIETFRCAEEGLAVPALDGLDLHGDERKGNLADFVEIFDEARRLGKITKAHAGELTGADSVRDTLDTLGVERIEHGVGAFGDADLVDRLKRERIVLDMCPWSNVKLLVHSDLATHPIRDFHLDGVAVTVSTDDPSVFGQTLTDEYRWLMTEMGMTGTDVGRLVSNGLRAGKLDAPTRETIEAEIEAMVADLNDLDGEGV